MGIPGLLNLLRPIHRNVSLAELSGQAVGIDTYVWLHRGAFACAYELCQGIPTRNIANRYIDYCMKRIRQLQSHNIWPVLVFDGDRLPIKMRTENDRRTRREENLAKAREYVHMGNHAKACEFFQTCVDVTPAMAHELIKELRKANIEYVVAPYEADAQLAYLDRTGAISAVITEDSDLLVFGCSRVIFKLDSQGMAIEIRRRDLTNIKEMRHWTLTRFRHMCILSGCDYLESPPGIGIKKSMTLLVRYEAPTLIRTWHAWGKTVNAPKIPADYLRRFMVADFAFLHQRVFDSQSGQLVPLHPFPEGTIVTDELSRMIGPDLPPDLAKSIAIGDCDPISKEMFVSAGALGAAPPPVTNHAASSVVVASSSSSTSSYFSATVVSKPVAGTFRRHHEPSTHKRVSPFKRHTHESDHRADRRFVLSPGGARRQSDALAVAVRTRFDVTVSETKPRHGRRALSVSPLHDRKRHRESRIDGGRHGEHWKVSGEHDRDGRVRMHTRSSSVSPTPTSRLSSTPSSTAPMLPLSPLVSSALSVSLRPHTAPSSTPSSALSLSFSPSLSPMVAMTMSQPDRLPRRDSITVSSTPPLDIGRPFVVGRRDDHNHQRDQELHSAFVHRDIRTTEPMMQQRRATMPARINGNFLDQNACVGVDVINSGCKPACDSNHDRDGQPRDRVSDVRHRHAPVMDVSGMSGHTRVLAPLNRGNRGGSVMANTVKTTPSVSPFFKSSVGNRGSSSGSGRVSMPLTRVSTSGRSFGNVLRDMTTNVDRDGDVDGGNMNGGGGRGDDKCENDSLLSRCKSDGIGDTHAIKTVTPTLRVGSQASNIAPVRLSILRHGLSKPRSVSLGSVVGSGSGHAGVSQGRGRGRGRSNSSSSSRGRSVGSNQRDAHGVTSGAGSLTAAFGFKPVANDKSDDKEGETGAHVGGGGFALRRRLGTGRRPPPSASPSDVSTKNASATSSVIELV